MLYMPVKWFDEPSNSPGVLAARLAVDAKLVNGILKSLLIYIILGLTSTCLGIIVIALSALITGPIIAFLASWRLSLISLGAMPLIILSAKL